MINPSNPSAGVYGQIIDASQRVAGVSPVVACWVGESAKGDVGVPLLITDSTRETTLGTLNPQKYGFAGYGLRTYLKTAQRAYYIRVVNQALTPVTYLTVDDLSASSPVIRLTNRVKPGTTIPEGVEGDPMKTIGFLPTDPGIDHVTGFFCGKNPGDWTKKTIISVRPSNPSGVPLNGEGHDPYQFIVDIYYGQYTNVTAPVESHTVTLEYATNEMGEQMFIEDVINSRSQYVNFKRNFLCPNFKCLTQASVQTLGGSDGLRATNQQIIDAWSLIDDPERYNIGLLVNGGYTNHLVQHKMAQVAQARNSYAILDTPSDKQSVADAITYRRQTLNLNTFYAGLYSCDILTYDEDSDRRLFVPISGYVASAIAYTAYNRKLWFAAAGFNMGLIGEALGVRHVYDQPDRDSLEEAQVNYVRVLPRGAGIVLWSQNTLYNRASDLQNCNVVLLSQYVLKSMERYTRSGVFEPNDNLQRHSISSDADKFMEDIRAGRGVYTYSNICDDRNNTDATIANGDMVLDMIYEAVIAVKRIHVRFNLNPSGSTFTAVQ